MVQSFQEGIVLFGVTLLLQMANYFKGKKVQLRIRIILIIGRMGYLVIFSLSKLSSSLMTHAYCNKTWGQALSKGLKSKPKALSEGLKFKGLKPFIRLWAWT